MLHPAPTSAIDPALARGILESFAPDSPVPNAAPACAVISFPNTSYQMHLRPHPPGVSLAALVGKRTIGVIRVTARRVDVVDTGGKYVEPVYGRPRRVQGRVVSADETTRTVVVDAGVPIHLKLNDDRQRVSDFRPGDLVSCDVLDGATFTPSA